jgi:putative ABC transport system permease protein
MSLLMTLRIALKALSRNKMRTILTMLGMIIGVGAVIAMVALGRGFGIRGGQVGGTNVINVNLASQVVSGRAGHVEHLTQTPRR